MDQPPTQISAWFRPCGCHQLRVPKTAGPDASAPLALPLLCGIALRTEK